MAHRIGRSSVLGASAAGASDDRTGSIASARSLGATFIVHLCLLVVLGSVLFFFGLGRIALLDPDEPFYAVPALEMLRTGTWAVPLLHGQPWFDKPALYYWTILGSYKLFGVSELTTRLSSACAGLVVVLILLAWGWRSKTTAGSRLRSLAAPMILATSLEYVFLSRAAITDMVLTMFLTLGMLAAARYLETDRTIWTGLAGAAFGLAALTKGPAGLILPAVSLATYAVITRRRSRVRIPALVVGVAGLLLTAAPWYVFMAMVHRDLLVKTFLGSENLGRFTSAEHHTFPLFYVVVLIVGLMPWSGALPAALWAAAKPAAWRADRTLTFEAASGAPKSAVGPLYYLCWFGGVVLVFSLAASKLATYILPAFPPAALMIADYWSGALTLRPWPGAPQTVPVAKGFFGHLPRGWISVALGGMISLIAAGAVALVPLSEWGVSRMMALGIAAVILIGSALSVLATRRRSLPLMLAFQTALVIVLVAACLFLAGPRLDTERSTRPLIRDLQARGLADKVVGGYRERDFSQDFYLGRTIPRSTSLRALEREVHRRPGGLWLVPVPNIADVSSDPYLRIQTISTSRKTAALRIEPEERRTTE